MAGKYNVFLVLSEAVTVLVIEKIAEAVKKEIHSIPNPDTDPDFRKKFGIRRRNRYR